MPSVEPAPLRCEDVVFPSGKDSVRGHLVASTDEITGPAIVLIPDVHGLSDLYRDLVAAGLGQSGASTIADITACPGTDTCKLGIASSRGLAAELRQQRITLLPEMLSNPAS